MANVASGVYPQMLHSTTTAMVVPTPYHYHHQPQHTPVTHTPAAVVQNFIQTHEPKKEPKKKKKVSEKNEKKKVKATTPNNSFVKYENFDSQPNIEKPETNCSRCNKKKCFKHNDLRNKNQPSKKTPEETVIQMKKHMLKIISTQDYSTFCKNEQKNGICNIDISKLHRSYLEEHEPQAFELPTPTEPQREYKPKIKQWLYRKIFLDEFKTMDYNVCKKHIGDLRRSIENVMIQKKKKNAKPKPPSTINQHQQMIPQDYSISSHALTNGTPTHMTRATMTGGIVAAPHPAVGVAPTGYQHNIMSLGVDTSAAPVSSMSMAPPTTTLHNSLATYMTQQMPTNILFSLGQQQQPPPPAQQQPLNLQTSHQSQQASAVAAAAAAAVSMQQGVHQGPGPGHVGPPTHAPPPSLPLNLHNHPYYVPLAPMLPLHMSAPQHNHQQQFQQNMLQQQQGIQGGFNQHAMYQ